MTSDDNQLTGLSYIGWFMIRRTIHLNYHKSRRRRTKIEFCWRHRSIGDLIGTYSSIGDLSLSNGLSCDLARSHSSILDLCGPYSICSDVRDGIPTYSFEVDHSACKGALRGRCELVAARIYPCGHIAPSIGHNGRIRVRAGLLLIHGSRVARISVGDRNGGTYDR